MRAGLERLARHWWAGELGWTGAALSALATPLSWAWGAAGRARERRFARRGATRVDGAFVVSIGNLAVGGTGKTPLAAWVAGRLERGGRPTAVVVGAAADDEALLHRHWGPGRAVLVGRDRVASARRARDEGARAIVADDAFQHRRLARDLDVVLLSADDPFPGPLLPCGPYREVPRALARADAVVVTRRSAGPDAALELASRAGAYAPGRVVAGVRLDAVGWRRLDGRAESAAAEAAPHGLAHRARASLPGGRAPLLVVCGVARAEAFRRGVEARVGAPADLAAFGDHHAYTPADVVALLRRAEGRPLVMTEKDAVKLDAWREELAGAYVLTEALRWDWGEERLADLVDSGVRRTLAALGDA